MTFAATDGTVTPTTIPLCDCGAKPVAYAPFDARPDGRAYCARCWAGKFGPNPRRIA